MPWATFKVYIFIYTDDTFYKPTVVNGSRGKKEVWTFSISVFDDQCRLLVTEQNKTFISNLEPRADKYEIIRILRKRYANELYLIIIINDINWSFQQWYCTVSVIYKCCIDIIVLYHSTAILSNVSEDIHYRHFTSIRKRILLGLSFTV